MHDPLHDKQNAPEEVTRIPFHQRWRKKAARAVRFDPREQWWRLLDALETRRALRRMLGVALVLVLALGASWIWVYPWWTRRNAISMTRQWINAGKLEYAAEAVRHALADSPARPEVWQLAAELARRRQDKNGALEYSRHAATLAPGNTGLALEWSEDALLAGKFEEAEKALASLPDPVTGASARAQRVAGEIARRQIKLTAARDHFETALRLDGSLAIDEVPLGTILINSRDPAERQRGLALLAKWAADRAWGATVLRTLLGDALAHDDRSAMLQWAEALRAHPACTLGDIPQCLLALSRASEDRFAAVLALLEKNHADNGTNAALLIGWLNQIGRSAEAAHWIQSLPVALTGKPPVVAIAAEALRLSAQWRELNALVMQGAWGGEIEFLRLAYGMQAARELGETQRADELWRTLQSDAQTNGVHALFGAAAIYTWGRRSEAVVLWWMAVEQPGRAVEALGSLARHYQAQRDAEGQFQVFRRLYSLRSQDPAIANNFAFFAALTGHDTGTAERVARENYERERSNPAYLATYAFVRCMQQRADEALVLLKPVAGEWSKSSALAFAYGFALASSGQKAEARPVLGALDPATLTTQEAKLIQAALD